MLACLSSASIASSPKTNLVLRVLDVASELEVKALSPTGIVLALLAAHDGPVPVAPGFVGSAVGSVPVVGSDGAVPADKAPALA
eukprot:6611508-Pyramimonas_sp.AAC.1